MATMSTQPSAADQFRPSRRLGWEKCAAFARLYLAKGIVEYRACSILDNSRILFF
jgi:hypothetical protein